MVFTHPELIDFWSRVVDPNRVGMARAVAGEIACYTTESLDVVLDKMQRGTEDLRRLWEDSAIDVRNPADIERFYHDQFVEAYELAHWHAGGLGVPPLHYARAALFAQRMGLRRALDFGSGIGTGCLCLAEVGCDVDAADVARQLLAFVSHRVSGRGFSLRPIDLSKGEKPQKDYYDLITCFDVLEHVPDQRQHLLELRSYLRPGGYLFVNLMEDSRNPDRPMHVSSAGNWLRLIRQSHMCPDWSSCQDDVQVLQRTRMARARNWVGSCVDRIQSRRKSESISA
jgi:2-polyprenyl-3-methyl-5-hydroxy-6-metoxy-1,4-benzoquinol methylase